MKRYLFLIIAMNSIVLFSCDLTKEIDYKTFYPKDKIVIDGYISKENGVEVMVRKTISPNQPESDDRIDSVTVSLLCNGREIALLENEGNSIYKLKAGITLWADSVYRIKAEAKGFDPVLSDGQSLLKKTTIDSVYLVRDTVKNTSYLNFEFRELPDKSEFFSYRIDLYRKGLTDTPQKEILPVWAFSDEGYPSHRIIKYNRVITDFDSAVVTLYSIPKFYYDFVNSYSDYEGSVENYYYETVFPVISNINGGFGYFTSYEADKSTYINKLKQTSND